MVGAGGAANTNQNIAGGSGSSSSWNGLSAVGGGGGGGSKVTGATGGSGGGAGATSNASGGAGTAGQGFAGGADINASGDSHPGGGGGGGAGAVGGNNGTSPAYNGGAGGNGLQSSITGTTLYYAGGGGGGSYDKTPATAGGAGGLGGGGTGGYGVAGTAGTANTGGGGGGGDSDGTAGRAGGNGGSGVVILRYAGAEIAGVSVGSDVVHTTIGSDEYQVYSYTSPTPAVANAFDLSGVDLEARLGAVLTTGIGGTGNLTYVGPGSLTLAADSSYVGTTTISAGTLRVGNGGTTGSLGSGAIINNSTLVYNLSDNLVKTVDISGSGDLVKAGTGTLTLSGSKTYTGQTIVSDGILEVPGALSTTLASVESGGVLSVAGSIAGSVVVNAAGTLAAGNSIGELSTGPVSFATAGIYSYEVDSSQGDLGVAADLLVTNGDLTIASGSILEFADIAGTPTPFPDNTTVFALINYSGTYSGGAFVYNGQPLPDGSRFVANGQMWEIDYTYSSSEPIQPLNFRGSQVSGSFVSVTAVPEPSTYVMLAIAGGMAAVMTRRRKA